MQTREHKNFKKRVFDILSTTYKSKKFSFLALMHMENLVLIVIMI